MQYKIEMLCTRDKSQVYRSRRLRHTASLSATTLPSSQLGKMGFFFISDRCPHRGEGSTPEVNTISLPELPLSFQNIAFRDYSANERVEELLYSCHNVSIK